MSNGTGYLLRYRQDEGPWQEVPLFGDIVIGRSHDCDISVIDERVSRRHVLLSIKPEGIWLTDLGSSNGTRIGSQTIPPQVPQQLDLDQAFFIGRMTLSVVSLGIADLETAKEQGIPEQKALPLYLLWYRYENQAWQQYPFETDIVIGRGSDCNLRLDDRNVSRHHVHLAIVPEGLSITDLGSQNGTNVTGQRLTPQVPQPMPLGSSFTMGSVTIMANLPGNPPPDIESTFVGQPQVPPPQIRPVPPAVQPGTMPPPAAGPQGTLPPPIYSPEFQQPPSFYQPPPSQRGQPPYVPPGQPPSYRVTPPGPPARKGISIWLLLAIGGLMAFLCVIAAAVAWFLFPVGPGKPDFAATQQAIDQTQIAIGGTPVIPPEMTPLPGMETPVLPAPVPTETVPARPQTWTVMVYADADDSVLEAGMFVDLDEAELIGSTDRVNIVWQLDRYVGAWDADGDWTSTKRFYVTHDEELGRIGSQEIYDMGEVNMSDPNTLVDFAIWAITTYPADKYVLIMSDHGSGWPGGWSDDDPVPDSSMWLNQIDDALAYVISQTSIGQFEMIGFDACLMGQMEVFSMIAPYARYGVASEETEPTLGWPYGAFLGQLVNNPDMSGADLAATVVQSYIIDDIIIVNDDYRNLYTSGSDMEGASADEVAAKELYEITMTAVDLSAVQGVNDALNNLVYVLQGVDQKAVAEARTYAQAYTNIFGEDIPAPYLDLINFARLVYERTGSPDVGAAVDGLSAAVSQAIILEKHGDGRPGSNGFSIYFPYSDLWQFTYYNERGVIYTFIASRFAYGSFWDEFLEFHYTGKPF